MAKKIEDILLEIGITPNLKGFSYICEAVEYVLLRNDYTTNGIYENIAKKHEYANYQSIERGIRYAISKVDYDKWRAIGGKSRRNFEFICTLSLIVRRGCKNE